ncbi:hypothetical protein ZWY2020_012611 [Hordeum vulgare]|nr:hypothetical protein ZWY2020_012611 [Hordeum vulgare]
MDAVAKAARRRDGCWAAQGRRRGCWAMRGAGVGAGGGGDAGQRWNSGVGGGTLQLGKEEEADGEGEEGADGEGEEEADFTGLDRHSFMKCFGKGIPVGCSEEVGDSDAVPFVPNDFAEDDDYPFLEDGDMDDAEFDKALYDLYVTHLSCAATPNVKFKRSSDFPAASTFTRYFGKLFSSCIAGLSPRQVVKKIIDLVQKSNADKPIIFQDWSKSLVLNVLGLIGDSAFKSPVRSRAEYPLDNKADSPTFKNSGCDNLPGSSLTTSLFAMPVAMPTSIPSGSPLKRCKPNVGVISNIDRVQCSKYVSERIINSPKTPFEQDGVLMVALPPSNNSNPVQSSNKNHVDLSSPEALNEFFNGRDDVVGIDEVQIVGTSIFSYRKAMPTGV